VIAAGSTGSIPATAGLIKAIAGLEQGAVVLPGADLRLDKGIWEQLSRPDRYDETLTACTHPQYGLARLLKAIGIDRSEIAELGEPKAAGRMRLVGQALLPAQQTMAWGAMATHESAGDVAGTALVEAPDGRMEALAIAIALRETLEVPGKTAALVTPDRMLAQRVAAELGRFAIAIDDSAGTPLSQTQAAGLARLALSACLGPADPVTMAALVKHPAVSGQDGAAARHARLFELAVLRDAIVTPAPGALAQAARLALGTPDRNRRAPSEVRYMLPDDAEAIVALGARIDAALSPLVALAGNEWAVPVATATEALSLSVRALAAGEQFFAMPGADELQRLFDGFVEMETGADPAMRLDILPAELPEVFDALVAPLTVRDTRAHHPRLSILGPLEARLQQFDRMILGGLNEGTWPGQARNDPFLNRPMKAELGLSTPERRIGQAAHDFQQLSGASEVIYTRSMRSEGAPTVASRWLQRLLVVAGEKGSNTLRAAGSRYLALANAVDATEGSKIRRVGRPNPKPAVELRPTGLSVTDIETWIRDPYAIHAKHVLKLRPLPPLERQADALLKGLIYHSILARHVTGEDRSLDALETIARQVFAENNVPADVAVAWLPRFMAVAGLFAEWEADRREEVVASHCEIDGSMTVENTGFTLRGRADRIDVMSDGSLAIIDYKTGTRPSVKEARSLSPQLSLEGKMAESGAFRLPPDRQVGSLSYVRLRKDVELPVDEICGKAPHTPAEVIGRAWSNLLEMIGKFQDPGWGYLSRRAPSREGEMSGDYDHLARVREWSSGDPEGGDD
jgi:ATP-dependent helicase/nuclease subunit B